MVLVPEGIFPPNSWKRFKFLFTLVYPQRATLKQHSCISSLISGNKATSLASEYSSWHQHSGIQNFKFYSEPPTKNILLPFQLENWLKMQFLMFCTLSFTKQESHLKVTTQRNLLKKSYFSLSYLTFSFMIFSSSLFLSAYFRGAYFFAFSNLFLSCSNLFFNSGNKISKSYQNSFIPHDLQLGVLNLISPFSYLSVNFFKLSVSQIIHALTIYLSV